MAYRNKLISKYTFEFQNFLMNVEIKRTNFLTTIVWYVWFLGSWHIALSVSLTHYLLLLRDTHTHRHKYAKGIDLGITGYQECYLYWKKEYPYHKKGKYLKKVFYMQKRVKESVNNK